MLEDEEQKVGGRGGGEGVAPQVRPRPSSLLVLWDGNQCLLQQEESEGQSTGLLLSCLCDRRLSVFTHLYTHTYTHLNTGLNRTLILIFFCPLSRFSLH